MQKSLDIPTPPIDLYHNGFDNDESIRNIDESNNDKVSPKNNYYLSQSINRNRETEEQCINSDILKRKEIYTYSAPFNLYSAGWSFRSEPNYRFRLAVASFIEEYNNKVQVVQLNEDTQQFHATATFDHPYPATKVIWIPDTKSTHRDLIATTGDYLRIWCMNQNNSVSLELLMNNNRSSEYCAPLTSCDWNEIDFSLIGTSSIDTTCTIWQVETQQPIFKTTQSQESHVKTQLIAHDQEVYDISFSRLGSGRDIFGSVGADGSLRMFDLRHMEYSTIVYEDPNRTPLLRLSWNKQDPNYLATFSKDCYYVTILDVRVPSIPVAKLENNKAFINGISWAPHSSCHLSTGFGIQALIWDIHQMPKPIEDPILAYAADGMIEQIHWSASMTDWISICYDNNLQLLRV
uniref:WD_REPEATS_REGION domain-containing protein n=1 Tax=Strongyloides stercoralis TaxID=6248 RepID=A0A0K0E8K9_STRER